MSSRSRLITYYSGFSSHLKFDVTKENLEQNTSTLRPLQNLILDGLERTDDFEIRNAYLGWCSLFLHVINNQQSELYNLSYNSIRTNKIIKTNCELADPFDLKSLECNNNETYLVCNDRKVKCWPKNNYNDDLIEISDLMDESPLKSRVKQISVGNTFVCALLESGVVRMMDEKGTSIDFELGSDDEFECVSCGLEFLILLTKNGLVYAFGSNLKGQLGIGLDIDEVKDNCKLIEALEGLKITQISTGGWHTLFLDGNGSVYSCGSNESGQLGIDSNTNSTVSGIADTPTLVNLPNELEFIMIKCGSRHSACVTSEGVCYVFGFNKYNQLALNMADFKDIRIPRQLELKGKVVSIECKFWSTLLQIYYP